MNTELSAPVRTGRHLDRVAESMNVLPGKVQFMNGVDSAVIAEDYRQIDVMKVPGIGAVSFPFGISPATQELMDRTEGLKTPLFPPKGSFFKRLPLRATFEPDNENQVGQIVPSYREYFPSGPDNTTMSKRTREIRMVMRGAEGHDTKQRKIRTLIRTWDEADHETYVIGRQSHEAEVKRRNAALDVLRQDFKADMIRAFEPLRALLGDDFKVSTKAVISDKNALIQNGPVHQEPRGLEGTIKIEQFWAIKNGRDDKGDETPFMIFPGITKPEDASLSNAWRLPSGQAILYKGLPRSTGEERSPDDGTKYPWVPFHPNNGGYRQCGIPGYRAARVGIQTLAPVEIFGRNP